MKRYKGPIRLSWHPELGDLADWIRRWEELVFGGPSVAYVYRESVELRYQFEDHERELSGLAEAVDVLRRLAGDEVRVVAGSGRLSFFGGNGERGGAYGVHAEAPAADSGNLRLQGKFATPTEVAAWFNEITETVFGRPYRVAPAGSAPYAVPIHLALSGLLRHRGSRPGEDGFGRCAFDLTSPAGDYSFYVNIDYFEYGTKPLLVPQIFERVTVDSPSALRDWLTPAIAALLGEEPIWPRPEGSFPEPLPARFTEVRAGKVTVGVGEVGTRWVENIRDVVPLLYPVIHTPCQPETPDELAGWLSAIGRIGFGTEVNWSTNWPGRSSPLKLAGDANTVAAELFALEHPSTARVTCVDSELFQIKVGMPERYDVELAGWVGNEPPLPRGA